MAVVTQSRPPPMVTEAHKEELSCLYILTWIGDTKFEKTSANNGAVVELINPKLVENQNLDVFEMNET